MRKHFFAYIFTFICFGVQSQDLSYLNVPEGFNVEVFAKNVENARAMTYAGDGIYFVGSRHAGNVYAVIDKNGDHKAEEVITIVSDLVMPSGVAYKDGDLFVAEVSQILRFRNIKETFRNRPKPKVLSTKYPADKHHGWKFIDFGPDGLLYVPVGAPCNVCLQKNKTYASITRLNIETGEKEIFAHGVRNSVGFDWHPETGELWFTDNGRDNLGDNMPPDELNYAPTKGMHFGFPYCHGGFLPDPEFGDQQPCANFRPPARQLGPHVAALGMQFYDGGMFPEEYKNQIIIPEHGSWNRTKPIGYRITLVKLDGNRVVDYDIFIDGWLRPNGDVKGRPNSLLVLEDGSMLVSDDKFGVIYRISYKD